MIQYDRLWATMTDRGMTQYKLIKLHGFSAGQIGRMKKNMHVSTHTLETLCRILNCRIEDIVEYTPEEAAPADALTANTALLTADAAAHRPNVNIPAPDPTADDQGRKKCGRRRFFRFPAVSVPQNPQASSSENKETAAPPKASKAKKGSKTKKSSKKGEKGSKKSKKK